MTFNSYMFRFFKTTVGRETGVVKTPLNEDRRFQNTRGIIHRVSCETLPSMVRMEKWPSLVFSEQLSVAVGLSKQEEDRTGSTYGSSPSPTVDLGPNPIM